MFNFLVGSGVIVHPSDAGHTTIADEVIKVEIEIVETDDIRKFAEPEDAEKYKKFEEKPDEDDNDDNEE